MSFFSPTMDLWTGATATLVGSRKAPPTAADLFTRFAYQLALRLGKDRTGDALGIDRASYLGTRLAIRDHGPVLGILKDLAEVYMPADVGHVGLFGEEYRHQDNHFGHCYSGPRLPKWRTARLMAADIHPVWDKLDGISKALHARNIFQVLGVDLLSPSDFLICWAPVQTGQFLEGGTNTAYQCALENGVPALNIWVKENWDLFEAWIVYLESQSGYKAF